MNADPKEHLKRYKDWSPSQFDTKGLGLEDRQDWFVAPVTRTRDSGVLEESNFAVVKRELEKADNAARQANYESAVRFAGPVKPENVDYEPSFEVHRFGHWGPGWFEIILCRPESKCAQVAADFACALADYPIADEEHHSQAEHEEADELWKGLSTKERLKYIRDYRSQFEFHDLSEVVACVRGKYFCGYASELIHKHGVP
jgi:hypothetical protein